MEHDAAPPLPHSHPRQRVLTAAELRALRIRGERQVLLPGVYLLRAGAVTSEERLCGALVYASRPGADGGDGTYGQAVLTGLAALALRDFAGAPPLRSVEHVDVLVPRTRRLRSSGYARIVRAQVLPEPEWLLGLPVAPVVRAVVDAVAQTTEQGAVGTLLAEAVGGGHCEPAALVGELRRARLLHRQPVADAVETLLAQGRLLAEERLYALVHAYGLPDPVWNVELRLPQGPSLGPVDAYWPEQAVAVELDTRAPHQGADAECMRRRERLEQLGVTVVHITPHTLRDRPDQQAVVVRTALMAAVDRHPADRLVALPRCR
ncbi:hypothetical protein [Streptomyces sp. NPDC048057]|uniref:hypothetical protein n=1 Tax=Streptomyces sp. NPDC048057 TaxID=3155628 RepID=UPI00340159D5